MNEDRHRLLKSGEGRLPASCGFVFRACLLLAGCWLLTSAAHAATFTNNAYVTVNDSSGSLSWNTNALTVSCWFRLSVPSTATISQNMTILVNRQSGDENSAYAYLIRFNGTNGNIEFMTKGATGPDVKTLIQRPYLDRWYHVAVKRSSSQFKCLVDGREVTPPEARL